MGDSGFLCLNLYHLFDPPISSPSFPIYHLSLHLCNGVCDARLPRGFVDEIPKEQQLLCRCLLFSITWAVFSGTFSGDFHGDEGFHSHGATPIPGWLVGGSDTKIKTDDLGVTPLMETYIHIYIYVYIYISLNASKLLHNSPTRSSSESCPNPIHIQRRDAGRL